MNDLVTAQDLIGWRAFLEGCVLQTWTVKQQEYYDWLEKKNTGQRWVETLIKRLWQVSWDMWEHRRGELKNPSSPALLREHARLDALITPEYDDIRQLAKKDRRWFRRPKEVLFTETIDYKLQWLESVSLASQRYSRRHRHDLNDDYASISPPTTPPYTPDKPLTTPDALVTAPLLTVPTRSQPSRDSNISFDPEPTNRDT